MTIRAFSWLPSHSGFAKCTSSTQPSITRNFLVVFNFHTRSHLEQIRVLLHEREQTCNLLLSISFPRFPRPCSSIASKAAFAAGSCARCSWKSLQCLEVGRGRAAPARQSSLTGTTAVTGADSSARGGTCLRRWRSGTGLGAGSSTRDDTGLWPLGTGLPGLAVGRGEDIVTDGSPLAGIGSWQSRARPLAGIGSLNTPGIGLEPNGYGALKFI